MINKNEGSFMSFVSIFEHNVQKTPNKIALYDALNQVTYTELNAQASGLAAELKKRGILPGDLIGIEFKRSIDQIVTLLAILKVGATYIPLDSAYLSMKKASVLQGIQVRLLIGGAEQEPSDFPRITAGEARKCMHSARPITSYEPVDPNGLAYVIFTSGTTGRPKGVQITNSALQNYLSWCMKTYTSREEMHVVLHSPLSFDATVTSTLYPLYAGMSIRVITEENTLHDLHQVLTENESNMLFKITPSHLKALQTLGCTNEIKDQKHLFVIGGEALTSHILKPWLEAFPNAMFYNEYGPTESTVGCCVKQITRQDFHMSNLSIGYPIDNVQLRIIQDGVTVQGDGQGELLILGDSLSIGYIHSPVEEKKHFIKTEDHLRGYLTGDLVKRENNAYWYMGRISEEYKINGYRIDLNEINDVLLENEKIASAASLIDREEEKLISFIVWKNGAQDLPTVSHLREALSEKLPSYMIPSKIIDVEELPVTSHGKVDKTRLLEVGKKASVSTSHKSEEINSEDMTVSKELVYTVWNRILDIQEMPSDTDTFFSLGGSSIQATQMISILSKEYGLKMKIRDAFVYNSFGKLSTFIDENFKEAVLLSNVSSSSNEVFTEELTI